MGLGLLDPHTIAHCIIEAHASAPADLCSLRLTCRALRAAIDGLMLAARTSLDFRATGSEKDSEAKALVLAKLYPAAVALRCQLSIVRLVDGAPAGARAALARFACLQQLRSLEICVDDVGQSVDAERNLVLR